MKRVGISELRKMTSKYLRELKEPLEICSKNQPVRVLIPYDQFMKLQDALRPSSNWQDPEDLCDADD